MGSIRVRPETGRLQLDFYFRGRRCREQTALVDSPDNRRRLAKLLTRIDAAITLGTFDYQEFFPDSRNASRCDTPGGGQTRASTEPNAANAHAPAAANAHATAASFPIFSVFAEAWFQENEPGWRRSHRRVLRGTLDRHLLPRFGALRVDGIGKGDILAFRAELAKVSGRGGRTLSAQRINHVMDPLRMILREAAERFGFPLVYSGIKNLRVARTEVEPFTLEEVSLILESVRADYRDYFAVKFFTGLRTAEIDGLKWQYVDFERREILVRESYVAGQQERDTKTPESQREIRMSTPVHEALTRQLQATRALGDYVFCTRTGSPLQHRNVTQRVWYPLLRHLGLKLRRPYQTRHTAATLWLAAGENPEWIARQLGHANTQMLFKVYSRYVPNLTRIDGSAFERLILNSAPPAIPRLPSTD
jgi:integrase